MNTEIIIAFVAGFAAGVYAGLHHCGRALGRLETTVTTDLTALEQRLKEHVSAAVGTLKTAAVGSHPAA